MQTRGKGNDVWLVCASCQGRVNRKIKLRRRARALSVAWPRQVRRGLGLNLENGKPWFDEEEKRLQELIQRILTDRLLVTISVIFYTMNDFEKTQN